MTVDARDWGEKEQSSSESDGRSRLLVAGSDHNEREHPGGEESQWKKIIVIGATVMDTTEEL